MLDRLLNMVGIGRATVVDDTGDVQLVQVTEGASGTGGSDLVTDKVPRVTEFGFASVPPLGSVVTVLRRSGERARSIVFGSSHSPSRPKGLKPGDTVLYDIRAIKVQMTADGLLIDGASLPVTIQNATTVTIKATQKVTIDAPAAEFTGTLHVTGNISTDGDLIAAGHSVTALRTAYNGHKHGGVAAGGAATAVTDTAAS